MREQREVKPVGFKFVLARWVLEEETLLWILGLSLTIVFLRLRVSGAHEHFQVDFAATALVFVSDKLTLAVPDLDGYWL